MKLISLIIILLLAISCSKSGKSVSKNVKEEFYLNNKSTSCSRVNLYKNVASKNNILSLFKCLKYEREFPSIYTALESTEEKKFQVFNKALSKTFFRSTDSRNKLFSSIIEKNTKASSMSMSQMLTSFISKRSNTQALANALKVLEDENIYINENFLKNYLVFMGTLNADTEQSRKEITEKFSTKDHAKFTLFIQTFFEDVLLSKDFERENFGSFIGKGNWFVELIKFLDLESLKKIIFFTIEKPELVEGVQIYEQAVNHNKYNCFDKSKSYVVDHKVEYQWQIENLFYQNREEFENELVSLVTRFNLYNQICNDEEFVPKTRKLLRSFIDYISISGGFEIMKELAKVSLLREENTFLLIDFFLSKSYKELEDVLRPFVNDKSFSLGVYRLLRSLKSEQLQNIVLILKSLDQNSVIELIKLWDNLSDSNKKSLIAYVTDMFVTQKNILPTFKFLNSINREQPESFIRFLKLALKKNSYASLRYFVNLANEDKIREELLTLFDEEHMFKLLSILQKRERKVSLKQKEIRSRNIEPLLRETKENCLSLLVAMQEKENLEYLISNYPLNCLGNEKKEENFSLKIIRWAKSLNFHFNQFSNRHIVGEKSFLDQKMMHFLHQMVHVTTKYVRSENDFSKETVNTVKDFLFDEKGISSLERVIKKLSIYEDEDKVLSRLMSLIPNNEKHIENDFRYTLKLLEMLSRRNESFLCKIKKDKCNLNIGLLKKQLLKKGIRFNRELILKLFNFLEEEKITVGIILDLISFLGKKNKNGIIRANQLEQILLSMSFKNSYYVVYFFNKLAKSTNYETTVKSLKNDFSLVRKLAPTLSKVGFLPDDASKRFKMVNSNLSLLDDLKVKSRNSGFSYGEVLIKLAKILRVLSPAYTQDINKISFPRIKKGQGHLAQLFVVASENGLISLLSNYISQNDIRLNTSLGFNAFLPLLNLDISLDEINFNSLPVNKQLFKKLSRISDKRIYRFITYLKSLDEVKINIGSVKERIDLTRFNKLFKIISDNEVDYKSFVETLSKLYSRDSEYINSLLKFSLLEINGDTRLYRGLDEMFNQSNSSFIKFFEDILAHFKLK